MSLTPHARSNVPLLPVHTDNEKIANCRQTDKEDAQTAFRPNASAAYPNPNWPIIEPILAAALRKPSSPGGIEWVVRVPLALVVV